MFKVLTKILSEEHGLPCERVEWDSPAVFENWSQEHLAIVQSPWNYHLKYDEFSSFLDQARRACGLWFVVCGLWFVVDLSSHKQMPGLHVMFSPPDCRTQASRVQPSVCFETEHPQR